EIAAPQLPDELGDDGRVGLGRRLVGTGARPLALGGFLTVGPRGHQGQREDGEKCPGSDQASFHGYARAPNPVGPPVLLRLRPPGHVLLVRQVAVLRPDQLEVAADRLAVAQRDRLAVEHRLRHLAVLLVDVLVAALGPLAGLPRPGRLPLPPAPPPPPR